MITLWDLPGWGTPANPTASYYADKHLCGFNAVLVVYADRPPEGVPSVLASCDQDGVAYAVVRNKADVGMAFLMSKKGHSVAEAEALMRATVADELAMFGPGAMFKCTFLTRWVCSCVRRGLGSRIAVHHSRGRGVRGFFFDTHAFQGTHTRSLKHQPATHPVPHTLHLAPQGVIVAGNLC